jgi:hypothetical protein
MTTAAEIIRRDLSIMADAQSRADSVYHAIGLRGSPAPMSGERPNDYRRRLLRPLLDYSRDWKAVPAHLIDDQVLAIAEAAVYADAEKEAARPMLSVAPGTLREVRKKNGVAGEVIEFFSDGTPGESTFIGKTRRPRRYVQTIRDPRMFRMRQLMSEAGF